MLDNLKKYQIVLGSNSPRRRELLAGLDIDFTVKTMPDSDESYPSNLPPENVPLYLAKKKAGNFFGYLPDDALLITADTIVILDSGKILGKPSGREEAVQMLTLLSGRTHQVVTGVCLIASDQARAFSVTSSVCFTHLMPNEISYYLDQYAPYDKAGSYGIQEWIGYVGVESIHGSFFNVMGLPVQRLYQELKAF